MQIHGEKFSNIPYSSRINVYLDLSDFMCIEKN